jgi:hypothetical protein
MWLRLRASIIKRLNQPSSTVVCLVWITIILLLHPFNLLRRLGWSQGNCFLFNMLISLLRLVDLILLKDVSTNGLFGFSRIVCGLLVSMALFSLIFLNRWMLNLVSRYWVKFLVVLSTTRFRMHLSPWSRVVILVKELLRDSLSMVAVK